MNELINRSLLIDLNGLNLDLDARLDDSLFSDEWLCNNRFRNVVVGILTRGRFRGFFILDNDCLLLEVL